MVEAEGWGKAGVLNVGCGQAALQKISSPDTTTLVDEPRSSTEASNDHLRNSGVFLSLFIENVYH